MVRDVTIIIMILAWLRHSIYHVPCTTRTPSKTFDDPERISNKKSFVAFCAAVYSFQKWSWRDKITVSCDWNETEREPSAPEQIHNPKTNTNTANLSPPPRDDLFLITDEHSMLVTKLHKSKTIGIIQPPFTGNHLSNGGTRARYNGGSRISRGGVAKSQNERNWTEGGTSLATPLNEPLSGHLRYPVA